MIYLCEIAPNEALAEHLNSEQLERFNGIVALRRRLEFLTSRLLFASVMAQKYHLRVQGDWPPGQPHPSLLVKGAPLYSSLSHSAGFVALALARSPVAVDLELMKPRDYLALAQTAFSPSRVQAIEKSRERQLDFYRAWCESECSIKWPKGFSEQPPHSQVIRLNDQAFMLSYRHHGRLGLIHLTFNDIKNSLCKTNVSNAITAY